jgi:flagellar basal body-associated protein FliL
MNTFHARKIIIIIIIIIIKFAVALCTIAPYAGMGCSQNKAHFTLGVKGDVQLKSSIPIGAKVEIRQKKNYIYIYISQGLYTRSPC